MLVTNPQSQAPKTKENEVLMRMKLVSSFLQINSTVGVKREIVIGTLSLSQCLPKNNTFCLPDAQIYMRSLNKSENALPNMTFASFIDGPFPTTSTASAGNYFSTNYTSSIRLPLLV